MLHRLASARCRIACVWYLRQMPVCQVDLIIKRVCDCLARRSQRVRGSRGLASVWQGAGGERRWRETEEIALSNR